MDTHKACSLIPKARTVVDGGPSKCALVGPFTIIRGRAVETLLLFRDVRSLRCSQRDSRPNEINRN